MDDRATTVLCLVWSKYREQASGGTYCADDDNDALMAVEEHLMCNAVIDGDGRFTDEAPDVFAEDGGAL